MFPTQDIDADFYGFPRARLYSHCKRNCPACLLGSSRAISSACCWPTFIGANTVTGRRGRALIELYRLGLLDVRAGSSARCREMSATMVDDISASEVDILRPAAPQFLVYARLHSQCSAFGHERLLVPRRTYRRRPVHRWRWDDFLDTEMPVTR